MVYQKCKKLYSKYYYYIQKTAEIEKKIIKLDQNSK